MSQEANCVFCGISDGTKPSSEVYRGDDLIAFMTDAPVNPGHVLVIPRMHSVGLSDLSPETRAGMFNLAVRVQAALRHSELRCEAVTLFLADGSAASQSVLHVHFHVIPRFTGDSFVLNARGGATREENKAPRENLDAAAAALRSAYESLWP